VAVGSAEAQEADNGTGEKDCEPDQIYVKRKSPQDQSKRTPKVVDALSSGVVREGCPQSRDGGANSSLTVPLRKTRKLGKNEISWLHSENQSLVQGSPKYKKARPVGALTGS
jgi:hypothetical protein